jgi:hypothetical protein
LKAALLLVCARALVQAREIDKHADDMRAERVAQEVQQRGERRAVGVGVHARAPAMCEEAHAPVGSAQRGGRVGGLQENRCAAHTLALLDVLPARKLGQCASAQGVGVEEADGGSSGFGKWYFERFGERLIERSEVLEPWLGWHGLMCRGEWDLLRFGRLGGATAATAQAERFRHAVMELLPRRCSSIR